MLQGRLDPGSGPRHSASGIDLFDLGGRWCQPELFSSVHDLEHSPSVDDFSSLAHDDHCGLNDVGTAHHHLERAHCDDATDVYANKCGDGCFEGGIDCGTGCRCCRCLPPALRSLDCEGDWAGWRAPPPDNAKKPPLLLLFHLVSISSHRSNNY